MPASKEFQPGLVRCTCRWCGEKFWANRISAQFCSPAHKQKIYRWRVNLRKQTTIATDAIDRIAEYLKFGESVPTAVGSMITVKRRIEEQMRANKIKDVR